MITARIALLVGVFFLTADGGSAQAPLELKPVASVNVPGRTAYGIIEPIKCDSNSNIYVQAYQRSDALGLTPVTKVTPDGKATTFPLPKLKDERPQILDFAPTAEGGIVLLVMDSVGHPFVDGYSEDGKFNWRFSLPAELDAMQIAVSPKGKILVSGFWSNAGAPAGEGSRPFAALFDRAGRVEREVTLTEESQASEPEAPEPGPGAARSLSHIRRTISLSSLQFSSNESFVLARLGSGGPIYTISPDGFEMSTLHPTVPPCSRLHSVKVDGDTVAALFVKKRKESTQNELSDIFVSLINSQTGEQQGLYHHSAAQLGAGLACYKNGVFTFLTTGDNDQLEIVRATAK